MKFQTVLPIFLPLLPLASAWGRLGHETIALVAQQYLLPSTITAVREILADNSTTYMGNVAIWADSFRYQPGGEFSSGFHYVNGEDAPPPESCEIIYPEDCPAEGCIIKAIGNYTERVKNKQLAFGERQQALKFIIHFLGDIAQPLHTEAFGGGANNITVFFNGYKTNLHAAWDTSIPNGILGLTPNANITSADSLGWANNIAASINNGIYERSIKHWLKDHNVKDIKREEKAATAWANDGNKEVCDYAITKPGNDYNGTDIGTEYFQGARPIVEMSVAKGGVRLAGWLNLIFAGKTGF